MHARRSTRSPLTVAIALLALAAGTAAGCGGGSDDDAPARSPAFRLRIVDLLPLSGDLAPLGLTGRKAADLAAAEARSAARRLGAAQSIEIVHADDARDPEIAVARAREQLARGAAACITGSWTTDTTVAVANELAIPRGILQISPAATADELTGVADEELLYRTVLPDSAQGRALADALERDLGGADGRRVSVAFEDNSYGTGLTGAFGKAWREKGGIVVGPVSYESRAKSYDGIAAQIVASEVDAYAIFGFATAYQKLGPALVRAGRWEADRTYVPDALAVRPLPEAAGAEATEGLRGTVPGAPEGNPATVAFARLFGQAGGPKRQTFDAQLFDAVLLCYLAAVDAGRADGRAMAAAVRAVSGPPGERYTWQQLPQAAKALDQGEQIDYQGASGPIDLNAAGDATAGVYDLFRFRSGRLEVYDQVPVGPAAD